MAASAVSARRASFNEHGVSVPPALLSASNAPNAYGGGVPRRDGPAASRCSYRSTRPPYCSAATGTTYASGRLPTARRIAAQ